VYSSGVAVADYESEEEAGQQLLLGEVVLGLSLSRQSQQQRDIIQRSVLITSIGLLFSVLLASWISYGIARSLEALTTVVKRLRRGDLKARSPGLASGELGILEAGINAMADTIESSQKALTDDVVQTTEELQRTVDELTEKNRLLDIAREEAMALGRDKSEFLARMSHEIRTPLNAVLGFSLQLSRRISGVEEIEQLRVINRAAEQLNCLVDDILTFTKLESDAVNLESMPFRLRECVEDVVLMLRPQAYEKQLELVLLIDRDVPEVGVGDVVRITQIVSNLLTNAIKFTEHGHVVLQVGLDVAGATPELIISVSDSGPGIAPEDQEYLFQAFTQADNSITRRFGGTGLGLPITRNLARLMGGDILLDSAVGAGARFDFLLPLLYTSMEDGAPELDSDQSVAPVSAGSQTLPGRNDFVMHVDTQAPSCLLLHPESGEPVCCALYDENPFSRRALRNMLLYLGVKVFATNSLTQLQALLEAHEIDILLLSVPSAIQSTEAIGQWCQKAELNPAQASMLLTSGAKVEGSQLPCGQWFINRPMRRETLCQVLADCLGIEGIDCSPQGCTPALPLDLLQGQPFLIVEDNPFNQQLLQQWLEEQGGVVDVVDNGRAAIALAAEKHYAVIFMDIHMPGMDGIEATRCIRQQQGASATTTISALTADVLLEVDFDEGGDPFDDVLYKPIDQGLLLEKLCAWLSRSAAPLAADVAARGEVAEKAVGLKEEPHFPVPEPQKKATHLASPELEQKLLDEVLRLGLLLQDAVEAGQWDAALALVHQLKGVAGYYQMDDIKVLASDLRECLKQQQGLTALSLIEQVQLTVADATPSQ